MNRIKELRERKGIGQKELAEKIKVTQQTISLYENGSREPRLETWQKLADFFGVSVPYLQGIQPNYTQNDIFKILNNNYFNSDNNSFDIHQILEEIFTFSPHIPKLDSLFSKDEIEKFTYNVQKYWQKYFSFLTNHKLIQMFYELPVSPQADLVLKERVFSILKDHVILITETP